MAAVHTTEANKHGVLLLYRTVVSGNSQHYIGLSPIVCPINFLIVGLFAIAEYLDIMFPVNNY